MSKWNFFNLFLWMFVGLACNNPVDPNALILDPEHINRLIPFRGELNNGIKQQYPTEPYKAFWVKDWNNTEQSVVWKVNAEEADYQTSILLSANHLEEGEEMELVLSNGTDSVFCQVGKKGWQRCEFSRPLHFEKGTSDLSVRISKPGKHEKFNVYLYSLEVVKPETYKRLQTEAKSLRSDATWMADLPYGFFISWNSKSMPKSGEPLSYEEAVNRFDVERFAKTMHECGGKLIFLTTSWAEYYFPAPIQTIDAILPGRTTKRDLVADLSEALSAYGIRLILYYHVGHGDKEWWSKQNYTRNDAGDLFTNLEKIIEEVSLRYGNKIAGFWMDDGIGYYPNGASFERITKAAKSGNKDNVICYNPWILPKLTEFQDYYAGELGLSLYSAGVDNPYLPVGGNGLFQGGIQEGLQATYSGTLEPGDWTHIYKDSIIGKPKLSVDELTKIVQESNKRKNLPMINVAIYQDGTISPQSEALLKEVSRRVRK